MCLDVEPPASNEFIGILLLTYHDGLCIV